MSNSCFLSHTGVFWGTFLVPILVVMVFNLVVFIRVIVVLVQHKRKTAARKNENISSKTIIRMMISVGGVMLLLGLTWLFAILTFSVTGLREVFLLLFTVFNSFQGFIIFLFVLSADAFRYWRRLLSCGSNCSHITSAKSTRKSKQTSTSRIGFSSESSTGGKKSSGTLKSDCDLVTPTKECGVESTAESEIPLN